MSHRPLLPPRERAAAVFIAEFCENNNYCPNLDEVAKAVGLHHRSGAADVIRRLRDARVLAPAPPVSGSPRTLRLADNVVVHKGEVFIAGEPEW